MKKPFIILTGITGLFLLAGLVRRGHEGSMPRATAGRIHAGTALRPPTPSPAPAHHANAVVNASPASFGSKVPPVSQVAGLTPQIAPVTNANTHPAAPGNALTFAGQRMEVEGFSAHPAGSALDLLFSAEIVPSAFPSPAPGQSGEQRGTGDATSAPGLTYEQELFRTKWGWAAFEQVQRAARDQAATPLE